MYDIDKKSIFFSDISSLNCRQTLEPAVYPTSPPLPHSSTDMVFTAEESISVILNLATLRFRSNSFGRAQAYTTSRLSNVIFRPGKCKFRPNDIVGFVRKTNAIHCHRRGRPRVTPEFPATPVSSNFGGRFYKLINNNG